jgi:hypothetical protein
MQHHNHHQQRQAGTTALMLETGRTRHAHRLSITIASVSGKLPPETRADFL